MESKLPILEHTTSTTPRRRGGGSYSGHDYAIPIRSAEQRTRDEQAQRAAAEQQLYERMQAKRGLTELCQPPSYCPPRYNTSQYWRDCAQGWISPEDQQRDHLDYELRRRRALDSKHNKSPSPHRHQRPAPRENQQFCQSMSTRAARDDRLTPQSKALLQVLVARAGRGRFTDTTKMTLGLILSRCPRSIQRYLQELIKFGYIATQTRKSRGSGFYVGIRIWIMDVVLPFFSQRGGDHSSEKSSNADQSHRNREETKKSLTNIKQTLVRALGDKKPPWWEEFCY